MAILGIDEVGRGPLAGPLVVGAVVLPDKKPEWVGDLRDSKKLTPKKREILNVKILEEALATGLGWVYPEELDRVGISEALRLATKRAVEEVCEKGREFEQIIIDGKVNFLADTELAGCVSMVVKADALIKEVSAASIIAKVARDNYMKELAKKYPEYGFESHVGYGTAKHMAAIRKIGICPEHRKSFEPIKSMVGFSRNEIVVKNTTNIGSQAENAVCEFLVQRRHTIVVRNFKTKICEIDVVSTRGDKIYFTEVKYRRNNVRGGGLAAVTKEKREQMRLAAEVFFKMRVKYADYQPVLAVAQVTDEQFEVTDWFPLIFNDF